MEDLPTFILRSLQFRQPFRDFLCALRFLEADFSHIDSVIALLPVFYSASIALVDVGNEGNVYQDR